MKSIAEFKSHSTRVVFVDIDGTLTQHGRLISESYASLWQLNAAGLKIIPVTGRPAGWCELIARLWPVDGVVGENGAFYFRLCDGKMQRHFARTKAQRRTDREKLRFISKEVREKVPGSQISSDQFARLFDLAIDFSEDVKPLSKKQIAHIVAIFHAHGAQAKVSNIHVNGWFGEYNKVTTCRAYMRQEWGWGEEQMKSQAIFVGDSPNDEPMFEYFPNSFAVANINQFLSELKYKPAFVATHSEGLGFVEVSDRLLVLKT
jgi:HAD superfamily hydrolase (TIGR01484 family)